MTPSPEFLAQHQALLHGGGLARLERTILILRGSDRIALLHSFCTNDIKQLQIGHGCEAFITSPQGKTLGHVFVFRQTDELLLNTTAGQAEILRAHFNRFIISEDVEITDVSSRFATLLVTGLNRAFQKLAPVPENMLQTSTASFANADVLICRVPFAGQQSFFVQVPAETAINSEQALHQCGAVACESDAVEAARIEAGFPLFGVDITEDNLPQEVGRDQEAISFLKGCYLGQETVARLDAVGHVNRRLVGLRFDSEVAPAPNTPLLATDKVVGQITSSAWSPRLQGPLAFGYVRAAYIRAGTALSSPAGAATVVSLPLPSA